MQCVSFYLPSVRITDVHTTSGCIITNTLICVYKQPSICNSKIELKVKIIWKTYY